MKWLAWFLIWWIFPIFIAQLFAEFVREYNMSNFVGLFMLFLYLIPYGYIMEDAIPL